MPMRLGVFGGTFDPLHVAHLILAAEAQFQLALDRVLWVLTPDPPHKDKWKVTPASHRLDMLQSTIGDNPVFEISRVDLDRPGPYYAVDTMGILRDIYPQAQLVYLMGGDSLHDLRGWHRPHEFVEVCDAIGVMRRPDEPIDLPALQGKIPGLSAKVRFVDAPLLQVSASEIRRKIAAGRPFRYYVPLSVYEIIRERDLYR
jgi:nicotinate-nucleotide adenylyltransferase